MLKEKKSLLLLREMCKFFIQYWKNVKPEFTFSSARCQFIKKLYVHNLVQF